MKRLILVGFALSFAAGCTDAEYFTIERTEPLRPVGQACTVNDQCEGGRCIEGICDDGLCDKDADCARGEICVFSACEPADTFACQTDQRPLLSVNPLSLELGEVGVGNAGDATVTIENTGDCLLTLSGVGLASDGDGGFSCEPCDVNSFPQRVPPQRAMEIVVRFTPTEPGEKFSKLLIRSDDATAGDQGVVGIDLHGSYSGIPVLVLDPPELNFGFVPFTAGGSAGERTETVRIMNRGTGNATLTTQFIFIEPGSDFSIPTELAAVSPARPKLLPPFDPNNPETWIDVPVTFHPRRNANQQTRLIVNAHAGDPAAAVEVPAVLTASSLGPPGIRVSTDELTFKNDDGTAYSVGTVSFRQVTIRNEGQSELNVNMGLAGESSDFSLSPAFVPPVPPGGAVIVSVFFNPSAPSDPATPHDPQRPFNGVFNITSNDTDPSTDVLKTVALRGWSKGGTFDDVLKLEMTYENADNSWAGNDYRNVDLELISPTGFSCTKPIAQFSPDGQGGFVATGVVDPCDDWVGFGREGTARWIAVGQYEEPERVLLYGLGQELANGQVFTARVHYVEDCANIPTGLLGDVLGIGASALLGVLGGAIGIPILVPPDQISGLISQNCFDHASSLATLHVSINGVEVASPQQRLRNKGDAIDIARIRRIEGRFEIVP